MLRVDIIVPVYNVKKYLSQCIESVLQQTYHNYKLILVDDGSTDGSRKICDEYAEKDARIEVIHKDNGGVSSARNAGIDCSTAEYITFIDSDDFIEQDYLEMLMKNIQGADCVISGIKFVGNVKETEVRKLERGDIDRASINQYYQEIDKNYVFYAIYAKIYRKDIITRYNIRFSTEYSILEDSAFVVEYLGWCKKWHATDYVGYNYRQIEEMSLRKKFHINAIDALKYRHQKSANIRKMLDSNNLLYYYQIQFTWINTYLGELLSNPELTNEEKGNKVHGYLTDNTIKELICLAPYDNIKHVKYNLRLLIYKSQFVKLVPNLIKILK